MGKDRRKKRLRKSGQKEKLNKRTLDRRKAGGIKVFREEKK